MTEEFVLNFVVIFGMGILGFVMGYLAREESKAEEKRN